MTKAYATFKKLGATDLAEVWLGVYRVPTGQRLPCLVHRLHPGLASNEELRRTVAALSARLLRKRHVGLADVVAAGDDGQGTVGAAHEYAPGVQLDVLLQTARAKRVGLSAPMAVNIAVSLAKALAALHDPTPGDDESSGPIFLSQLAPQCVLVGVDGEVRIHGAAFAAAVECVIKAFPGAVFNQARRYLAPEVASGHKASVGGDLYGLGVILWEALAQRDYDSKPLAQVAKDVPAPLAALVTRCLAADPAQRPDNADRVARELSAFLNANWPRYDSKQLGIYAAGVAAKALKAQKAEIADALARDDLLPPPGAPTEPPRLVIAETIERGSPNSVQMRRGRDLELNENAKADATPDLAQQPARRGEVAWDAIIVPPDLKRPRRRQASEPSGGSSNTYRPPSSRGSASGSGSNLGVVALIATIVVAVVAVAFKSGALKSLAAMLKP